MYLKIRGNSFRENIFREIAAITDRAKLKLRKVEHRKNQKLVVLPIDRYEIVTRKKWLGIITPYKHDKSARIRSTITIMNVVDCRIENNLHDMEISEITMLFGLKIAGNQISVCSAEEVGGTVCYTISLNVSEIDLEIGDEN